MESKPRHSLGRHPRCEGKETSELEVAHLTPAGSCGWRTGSPNRPPPAPARNLSQACRSGSVRVRWMHIAIVFGLVGMALLGVVVVSPIIDRQVAFGTFSTEGPPPRIDYLWPALLSGLQLSELPL